MDLVLLNNGEPLTTSRIVSDVFGKTHKDVLRAIDNVECSEEFRGRNFTLSSYKSKQGKVLKCVDMTRDGFSFLCMGFTGSKAAKWKEQYINAFNQMEKGLLNIDARLENLEREALKIKQSGSQWAKMGHEINRIKKGHLLEVQKVIDEVQMKLEF